MAKTPKPKAINEYTPDYALYRGILPYTNLNNLDGNVWRTISRSQPIVLDAITTLTMHIQSLPYSIRARDSNRSDELKDEITYYLDIFKACQDGDGFLNFIDYFFNDYYTTPFGAGVETIRYSDGRLYTFRTLDSATLYLNPNPLLPYYQYVPEVGDSRPIYFNRDELVRIYQSPRPELQRRGWQMTPVEKAYLSIEMLNRGDKYYANLLLDTPEAGLLDLGDMSKESAEAWLKSFRDMFTGIDAFKIPVLFEHTTQAKYIPFGRPPTDLLFNEVGLKYAQILLAAFGLTLADIGMGSGGGSGGGAGLSTGIRSERHSKATGFASAKSHVVEAMNKILPEYLEFWFVDVDDELLVSKGRARSANAVAMRNLTESGILTPTEARAQLKADGLLTIPLPETVESSEFDIIKEINGQADQVRLQEEQIKMQKQAAKANPINMGGQGGKGLNKQRQMRGGKLEAVQGKDNVPASQGGQGEIKSLVEKTEEDELFTYLRSEFLDVQQKADDVKLKRLLRSAYRQLKQNGVDKSQIIDSIENSIISEPVEKSINDIREFSKRNIWWHINLDENKLASILKARHIQGILDAAHSIQHDLYEEGIIDEIPNYNPDLTDDSYVIEQSNARSKKLASLVNSGTDYFINRLLLLSLADIFEENPEDIAVENSVSVLRGFIGEMFTNRATIIAEYENLLAYNEGLFTQYKSVGITEKAVLHIGKDEPCEECQFNIGLGYVKMEYPFITKFGDTTLTGPFHTNCHCTIVYNKKELKSLGEIKYYNE